MNDTVVAVHPVGKRAHIAEVELNALQDVHWSRLAETTRVVHAYVSPSEVVSGDLVQSDAASGARVLVCIRQSLNTKVTFSRLMERLEQSAVTPRSCALL